MSKSGIGNWFTNVMSGDVLPERLQKACKLLRHSGSPLDLHVVWFHNLCFVPLCAILVFIKQQHVSQEPQCIRHGFPEGENLLENPHKLELCIMYTSPNYYYIVCLMAWFCGYCMLPHILRRILFRKKVEEIYFKVPQEKPEYVVHGVDVALIYSNGLFNDRMILSACCVVLDMLSLMFVNYATSSDLLLKIFHGVIASDLPYIEQVWREAFPTEAECVLDENTVFAFHGVEHYGCTIPFNEYYRAVCTVTCIIAVLMLILSVLSMVYQITTCVYPFNLKSYFDMGGIPDETKEVLIKTLPRDAIICLHLYLSRVPSELHREVTMAVEETIRGTHQARYRGAFYVIHPLMDLA